MTSEITKKHIGKRVLLTDLMTGVRRTEADVLEISPSGKNVKLRNPEAGNTYWQDVGEEVVVEVLSNIGSSDPHAAAVMDLHRSRQARSNHRITHTEK